MPTLELSDELIQKIIKVAHHRQVSVEMCLLSWLDAELSAYEGLAPPSPTPTPTPYHLASAVELSQDAIISKTLDGIILSWNAGAQHLYGYTADEAIGQPITMLIPAEMPDEFASIMQKLKQGQTIKEYQTQRVTKAGDLIHILLSATPIKNEQGDIVGASAIARNISDRIIAERTQYEQDIHYRLLFEQSHDSVFITTLSGEILEVNPSMLNLLGYGVHEKAKINARDFYFNPTDRDEFQKDIEQEGVLKDHQVILKKKDGTAVITRMSATLRRDENNNIIGYQGIIRDITEQTRILDALRESEARFRSYFELGLMGLVISSTERRWLEVNDKACEILGYTRAELLQMTWSDITYPDDLPSNVDKWAQAMAGEVDQFSLEKRFVRKDGGIVYAQIDIGCVRKLDGTVDYFLGLIQDISQRRLAEINKKESEGRLWQAMQVANLGIWDWEIATDKTIWLGEIFRMYGIKPEDFTGNGSDYFEFTHPEDREFQQNNIVAAFEHGVTEKDLVEGTAEIKYNPQGFRIMRPDGSLCYVQGDAVAVVDENGQPLRMVGVLQDITKQKLAEEELRRHRDHLEELVKERTEALEIALHDLQQEIVERQLAQDALLEEKQQTEAILAHVADAILFTDLDGNILYVNSAWENITGYTYQEVVGKNASLLQSPQTSPLTRMQRQKMIFEGQLWSGLVFNVRSNGEIYDSLSTVAPVKNAQGNISHFVEVHRDVTAERQLAAMKEEFIANAAHDLRNPITVLRSRLYLLKQNPSTLDSEIPKFEKQINRLNLLVDDLLILSRLDRHVIPPKRQLTNLNTLLAEVVYAQQTLAAEKNQTLTFNPSDELPLIAVDVHLLERVAVNLIANAIHYTPSGGHITVSTAQVNDRVNLTVTDDGLGIAPSELPHIFDRFFRSKSIKANKLGTGLGLAIVKEIVDLHQGTITVESELGEGTQFHILLPIQGLESLAV